MSIQQYALLNAGLTFVQEIDTFDSSVFSGWQSAGNPKATFYRVVNMTTQPTFNPLTQMVTQNGWTISDVDVQPVWVVQALSTAQQQAASAQVQWTNTLALNIVTAANNAITNWGSLTAGQKDTVLLDVVKVVSALLTAQYSVSN